MRQELAELRADREAMQRDVDEMLRDRGFTLALLGPWAEQAREAQEWCMSEE